MATNSQSKHWLFAFHHLVMSQPLCASPLCLLPFFSFIFQQHPSLKKGPKRQIHFESFVNLAKQQKAAWKRKPAVLGWPGLAGRWRCLHCDCWGRRSRVAAAADHHHHWCRWWGCWWWWRWAASPYQLSFYHMVHHALVFHLPFSDFLTYSLS